MAKISENMIPDINADWGLDASNNLPYSGEAVQEFIKRTFKQKYGYFHYDDSNNRYLVFADEESKNLYISDPSANASLLLSSFDAPFNYSAKIEMISESYKAVLIGTVGNLLQFKFAVEDKSGNSTGENADCTITLVNQGVKKTINKIYTAQQGREGIIVELDDYLTEGTNNISINIKGVNSLAATTVSVVYQLVNLKFTDSLDISRVYNTDELLEISCVVEGAGTKVIDWFLDGQQLPYEITDEIPYITAYTVNKNISLKGLNSGVHSIQYRLRSQVGENQFYSQTLFRNFFVSGVDETIIGIATELPVGIEPVKSNVLDRLYGMIQYVPYNLRYAIYNPSESSTNTVQIFLNNELQLTTNIVNGVENNSSIMSGEFGNLPVKITVNGVDYEMTSDTAISTIGVSEIADAKLNLRAFGRDNGAIDRESWTYGDYSTTFNGLYWNAQSGWVDNTLIINAGASASINYIPFEKDPMSAGKTIEVEFATRNVIDNDGIILDLTNENGHGLLITASEARLVTSDNKVVSTKFKAEEHNRISFVINRRESGNNAGFVFIYVNGILSGAAEYSNTATIRSIKNIVFNGSSDVLLKQIVIYDKPLSSDEILNNYILYRDSISEMLSIYNRNNVTTDDGQLSPEKLVNTLPVMYFTGLDETRGIPFLETQTGKAATKIDTYFDIEYENAQDKELNFKLKYARVRIQGTSSSYYPRKNYRFYSNKEDESVLYDWQGNVIEDRQYSFKKGAQPVDCWCLKTDYAESSGAHNTGVAKLWNKVMKNAQIEKENVLMTTAQKVAAQNGYPYDVRTTVDGFPIVVFYRNSYNHPWQFLGKFNFNNDKSTPSVFGFCDIPGFDNSRMQCWEVLNNGHALCNFTRFDDEYFDENWEDAFEARYDEDNPLIDDLKEFCRWIYSTKGASDGVNILDESLMEKFKTEKWDHLDVYKMAAYYVYIMRFGAVDQTVKNSMFTSEDGEHYFFINYDNDTIFGVRNDGLLKHGPYIDRQSIDPEKAGTDNPYVYAGHDSVLWNNLECDLEFMEIVKKVDSALHDAGLTYSEVINMFENEQTLKWCEKVCNTDAHYKYIAPPSGRVIESLQGNRNSHRRWWVSERFNLYDAKFVTGDFKNYVVELKIVGEQIPFAKITAAKRQPYGYEILNSASLVTDVLNIGDSYEFVSPEGQTLQEGDPISIYSACNIEELDLSGCMDCALKVDLSRIHSPSVGNSLKRLIVNGNNNALSDTTFVGTDKLTRLEYIDIQGMHKLGSIDLSNSLNLKTLLAKNSGLTEVKLAPGCLIERLELPTSTAAVVLEDLPLLTHDNLILEGDWANVRQIKISGCPNITNNFNLIWNWYDKTRNIEVRSVDIQGVNWEGVNIDQLIELGQNTNMILKGSIKLTGVDDKFKLLTLKELYGENIFNTDSDLHIYGPDAIFVFGPEDRIVLEGNNYQFETIVFSDEPGTLVYDIRVGSREGTTIDENTGLLTTIENGLADSPLTIVALFVSDSNDRFLDEYDITVQKRVYPQAIKIEGVGKISQETTTYTWSSPTQNVTGVYRAEWTLSGEILNYVKVQYSNERECTITRFATPENLATGTLTLKLYKVLDNSVLSTTILNVSVVNPNVIMTMETNPEVLTILYNKCSHRMSGPDYLLKTEADKFTNSDIYVDATNSIFTGSGIIHFEEFEYFTNLTKIPAFCFSGCGKLKEVIIPENVETIGLNAFQNTILTTIYIPRKVKLIDQRAFSYCKQLTNIVVDNFNTTYCSSEGSLYMGAKPYTLYMVAPGLTEYVMPENTTSVYGDGDVAWSIGTLLRKITLNEKVQGITGRWFMYGFSNLTEVTGVERSDIKYYNGCVYNSDYSKLIYWPSGKVYSEAGLKYNDSGECLVREFGERAFSQNKLFTDFVLPKCITKLGEWVFYSTSMKSLIVHENVTEIGNYCFSWNSSLQTVDLKTNHLLGTNVFANCSKLSNMTLANIPYIPESMFSSCSRLTHINIPETVVEFGNFAFSNSGLTTIIIPSNVRSIGSSCFLGCTELGDITSLPSIAPSLGTEAFGNSFTNYTGILSDNKQLSILSNANDYESGDWKNILQDKVGFTLNKTL